MEKSKFQFSYKFKINHTEMIKRKIAVVIPLSFV